MIVLSHRGYWRHTDEKNQRVAFERSFDLGFGTETDVRDRNGVLVISHDMPRGNELEVVDVIDVLAGRNLPLALNIKADGLGLPLKQLLDARGFTNWFTFDMSVPDLVQHVRHRLPAFTRISDLEPIPALYEEVRGVWVDGFSGDWQDLDGLQTFVRDGKQVCIVSPELHGRQHHTFWKRLKEHPAADAPGVMLCTDLPEAARAFFSGEAAS